MRSTRHAPTDFGHHDTGLGRMMARNLIGAAGIGLIGLVGFAALSLASWSVTDPSLSHATGGAVHNLLGRTGAIAADLMMQLFGLAAPLAFLPALVIGWRLSATGTSGFSRGRLLAWVGFAFAAALALAGSPVPGGWPLPLGLGGVIGDMLLKPLMLVFGETAKLAAGIAGGLAALGLLIKTLSPVTPAEERRRDAAADRRRAARDEDDGNDGLMPLAMLHHWWLVGRANLLRMVGRRPAGLDNRHHGFSLSRSLDRHRHREDYVHEDDYEEEVRPVLVRGRREPVMETPRPRPAATPRVAAPPVFDEEDELDADMSAYEDHHYAPEPAPQPAQRRLAETRAPERQSERQAEPRVPQARQPAARAPEPPPMPAYDDVGDDDYYEDEPVPQAPVQTRSQPASQGQSQRRAPVAFLPEEDDEMEAPEPVAPRAAAGRQPAPVVEPMTGRKVSVGKQAKPLEQVRRNAPTPSHHDAREAIEDGYQFPSLSLLAEPKRLGPNAELTEEVLEGNAGMLEGVLDDFGIKGEIIHVRPGPVVTLYELRPAPGVKSSRVIGLADDIARSMSAVSARVAVVPGHNVIGIELPNQRRETVYFREMIASPDFQGTKHRLAVCLGKTIGGEPVIVDLARMPHLLVAGTTGSGKSVAINTMIMSLLYRLTPEECKLIMIDPKMLELSVYDGIPHLLTPVVTDPKKAVVALKWTVKEMEDRYRKMSKLGVRNIDGYNARVSEAKASGEVLAREVQTGFHRQTGEPIYEMEELALDTLPYIVVIVDEMADLMMVAGKEIEGAIQRLAQMARAAGIHIVMATQRPSVDVITGTIKANFPTRISFQVTSKIDSRTILGEQGAEQLLGQGDMLYMAPGGRIQRVHGPFVSDNEVEKIVHHLKRQGAPQYLEAILAASDEEEEAGDGEAGGLDESSDLYDKAVGVVLRDKKASTSYIQRRLQIGYNRAASLIERMEREGVISPPGATGKREVLLDSGDR